MNKSVDTPYRKLTFWCVFAILPYKKGHQLQYLVNILQQLSQPVHHALLVLQKGVGVAVQGDGGVLVPQYFGKRLYVHAALDGACGKGVPQGMKPLVRYFYFFEQQFEASLVGTDGNGLAACRHHEGRIASFLHAFKNGQQLFGQWYYAAGGCRFRLVHYKPAIAVVAGLGNGKYALCKIDIAPLQRQKLAYAQAAVQAQDNAVQLILLSLQHGLLYFFLLGKGKAFHRLFFELRALDFVRRVFLRKPQIVRRAKRALNDGYHGVDAVCRQAFARFAVAPLQKPCYERLRHKRRQTVQRHVADALVDMLLYNKPVPLVRPHFYGRANVVFQPLHKPVGVPHACLNSFQFFHLQ